MPKKTCKLIVNSSNDYVIAVKDNQPTLNRHIKRIAALHKPASRYIATEKTRDRFTTRTVEVFHHLTGINPQWAGIKSLIRVERVGTRGGKQYHQIVSYITIPLPIYEGGLMTLAPLTRCSLRFGKNNKF